MELLKRRPIALISVISIVIMYLSSEIGLLTWSILLSVIPASLAAIYILVKSHKNLKELLKRCFCLLIFIAVSLTLSIRAYNFFTVNYKSVEDSFGKECIVSGEVIEIGYRGEYAERLYVTLSSIDGLPVNVNVVLEVEGESHLYFGDVFSLNAVPKRFDDIEKYLLADGYAFKITCDDVEHIEFLDNVKDERSSFFRDLNDDIQNLIYRFTDEDSGSFLGALILGNRDLLPDNVTRDFRRSGVSHVLALSGLHMTIIVGFFDLLLMNLHVDKRIRCVLLSFLGFVYLAITGFSMSAARAVIFLFIVYLSHLLCEDSDSITALSLATVLILAINPYALVSVSLWMSVIATLGIIVISEIITPLGYKIKKKPLAVQLAYKILVTVSLTLAAIFFVSVFNWLCFGEISIIAPLTNLIITPLITAILVLGLTMLLLSFCVPIASFVGSVTALICDFVLKITDHIAYLRNITVSLEYDFVKYISIPFIVLIALFLLVKIKHKWTIALIPSVTVIAFIICFNVHTGRIDDISKVSYVQNVSSEMLVVMDNGSATICDISTGGNKHFLLAYECALTDGAVEIENVILTHYHNYHPSSLLRLSSKYIVRNIFIPAPESEDETDIYNIICNAFYNTRVNVVTYRRGYAIDLDDDLSLNVSPTYYIKRSKHPMLMVSVKRMSESDKNELLYFSSPIFENPSADYPTNPDFIIVGSHGPLIYDAPGLDLIERSRPSVLFLADAEEMLTNDEVIERLELLRDKFNVDIVFNKSLFDFILE